ncbi:unnamed protein product [Pylaiella littoralis]
MIRLDPVLADLVGLVEARNDAIRGTGLLFPTLAWYEFISFVENGFYHILQDPYFPEAYLGDLPAEILRVVSESAVVKEAWAKYCPAAGDLPPFEADSSILDEVFAFVMQKFLHVRLGDYAHRLTEVSTLSLSKGELALRQQLKAASSKVASVAREDGRNEGERPSGSAAGDDGGAAGSHVVDMNLVNMVNDMSDKQLLRLTKQNILQLIQGGGAEGNARRTKAEFVATLREIVGGSGREGSRREGVAAPEPERSGVEDGGLGSATPDLVSGSVQDWAREDGGTEWWDMLPSKDVHLEPEDDNLEHGAEEGIEWSALLNNEEYLTHPLQLDDEEDSETHNELEFTNLLSPDHCCDSGVEEAVGKV